MGLPPEQSRLPRPPGRGVSEEVAAAADEPLMAAETPPSNVETPWVPSQRVWKIGIMLIVGMLAIQTIVLCIVLRHVNTPPKDIGTARSDLSIGSKETAEVERPLKTGDSSAWVAELQQTLAEIKAKLASTSPGAAEERREVFKRDQQLLADVEEAEQLFANQNYARAREKLYQFLARSGGLSYEHKSLIAKCYFRIADCERQIALQLLEAAQSRPAEVKR